MLEVAPELSCFCKMVRMSKVVGPRWSIVDICIFVHFKVNCEVRPLHSFAKF